MYSMGILGIMAILAPGALLATLLIRRWHRGQTKTQAMAMLRT